jgi:hypothetical protein
MLPFVAVAVEHENIRIFLKICTYPNGAVHSIFKKIEVYFLLTESPQGRKCPMQILTK